MRALLQNDWTSFVAALIAAILTAIFRFAHLNSTLTFLFSAISLAVLALVVGHATEQLGNFLGREPPGLSRQVLPACQSYLSASLLCRPGW